MAEGAEDRTEAATPNRLRKAQEQGQVALSREVPALMALVIAALLLMVTAPHAARELTARLTVFLSQSYRLDLTDNGAAVLDAAAMALLHALAPFLGASVLAAVAANVVQTGGVMNIMALLPSLARLSPMRGLSRLFGASSGVTLLKDVAKIGVVGAACWYVIVADLPSLASAVHWPAPLLVAHLTGQLLHLLVPLLAIQATIAAVDIFLVRRRFGQSLRMSREELKQETKENDGDPQVKNRLRQLRRQRVRKRMLAAVAEATVVVTNPTHYAVALRYDRDKNAAPQVVAKGADEMAARIRAAAEEHRVPMVANPPLARALFLVPLDDDIPPEHYKAVAELIAYVWRLQGRVQARMRAVQ